MSQPLKTNDVVSDALKTSPGQSYEELARQWCKENGYPGPTDNVIGILAKFGATCAPTEAQREQAARRIANHVDPNTGLVYEYVLQILRDTIGGKGQ